MIGHHHTWGTVVKGNSRKIENHCDKRKLIKDDVNSRIWATKHFGLKVTGQNMCCQDVHRHDRLKKKKAIDQNQGTARQENCHEFEFSLGWTLPLQQLGVSVLAGDLGRTPITYSDLQIEEQARTRTILTLIALGPQNGIPADRAGPWEASRTHLRRNLKLQTCLGPKQARPFSSVCYISASCAYLLCTSKENWTKEKQREPPERDRASYAKTEAQQEAVHQSFS